MAQPWDDVVFKLPEEVAAGLLVDSRNRLVHSPNIRITTFAPHERMRPDERALIPNLDALHKSMQEQMYWLVDLFRHSVIHRESTYGAPRPRAASNLGFMLGIGSKYLQSSGDLVIGGPDSEDVADPDIASAMSLFGDDLWANVPDDDQQLSDENALNYAVARRIRRLNDHFGVEASDDDDDINDGGSSSDGEDLETLPDSNSKSQQEGTATESSSDDNDHKVKLMKLPNCAEIPNFENTVVHDYYAHTNNTCIDISDIEARMIKKFQLANPLEGSETVNHSSELDKILLDVLEKGDGMQFSRLVSAFRWKPFTLTSRLLHDISMWKSWLINGQHLCFYGAGSKRQTMKAFAEVALKDGYVLTMDVYRLRGSSCDGLWYTLKNELLPRKACTSNVQECKLAVLRRVESIRRPFYFIVLGLDMLVSKGAFGSLISLIRLPNVRLIGTMDHLRASLVVSVIDHMLRNYRLVHLSTGLDYRSELLSLWEHTPPRFIMSTDTNKSANEVHAIVSALSLNHRQLFSLIARIQLEKCRGSIRFDGIDKYGLLRDRRAITICNTESKLDALLTEFITHNILEQSRGPGGKLYLVIPFQPAELEQFLSL